MYRQLILAATLAIASIACAQQATVVTTITAPAKFGTYDSHTALVVSNGTQPLWIRWSYRDPEKSKPDAVYAFELKTGETCTFTIEDQVQPEAKPAQQTENSSGSIPQRHRSFDPVLIRVTRDGKVIYDREVCEVHHRRMQYKETPIIYGLLEPAAKQPTAEQFRALFPHQSDYTSGGCCIMPRSKTSVYFCGDCKAAYTKWMRENLGWQPAEAADGGKVRATK